jgi:hypothetical protein
VQRRAILQTLELTDWRQEDRLRHDAVESVS